MNSEFIKKIRNSTILVIIAQIVVLLASVAKNLIIPYVFIDVEMYALWQIYSFYLSYLLILTLGFEDGVYIKYTGKTEKYLNKSRVKDSIKIQILFTTIITILLVLILCILPHFSKKNIYILVVINLLPLSIINIFLRVFQAQFEMKKYSTFATIHKVLFVIFLIFLCFLPYINEYYVIVLDVILEFILAIYLLIKYRMYWIGKIKNIKIAFLEWSDSIKTGLFILIMNYLVILLMGIGRVFIEAFGTLTEYAMYSLAISIASIITVFINAIGSILFPALRNIETEKYKDMVKVLNIFLTVITPIVLISYFILARFINAFLPNYVMALDYLSFVMCMVMVKCYSSLIYIPIMKSLRMEKKLLRNSLLSLTIFSIIFIPLYILTKNVLIITIGTLIVSYIELYLNEYTVKKECSLYKNYFNLVLGIIILLFILLQSSSLNVLCIIIQLLILILLLIVFHKEILQNIKKLIKT